MFTFSTPKKKVGKSSKVPLPAVFRCSEVERSSERRFSQVLQKADPDQLGCVQKRRSLWFMAQVSTNDYPGKLT